MARPTDPGVEDDLDLDGGIAAGVEDLPADDLFDEAHCVVVTPVAGVAKVTTRDRPDLGILGIDRAAP